MRDDVLPIDALARIALGDVTLDLARERLVDADGASIELRPQAFAVLRHLGLNAGRLVSKEELFAAVWPGVVVTDDSLVQAIGDVRRALGADGHRILKTAPRRGYCLTPPIASAKADAHESAQSAAPLARDDELPPIAGSRPSRRRWLGWIGLTSVVALASLWLFAFLQATQRSSPFINPTLSVRPFESVSTSGDRAWLGDAMSIDIASTLARLSNLPVLLDKTTRGAPNASTEPSPGAQASHVLAGSVQSDEHQVRVTIHLTEAGTGRVIWSERYERPMDKLFELEDEITASTVTALQVKLIEGEQARSRSHPKGNLKAWELATLGYLRFETGGPLPLAEARQLFEQALALDADYAWARSYQAATCLLEARFNFVRHPALSMQRAFDEATRAVAIDPGLPDAWSTLGSIQLARRQFDDALSSGKRAIALGPNDAEIHAVLAQTMLAVGDWEQAVRLSRKAIALTVRPPSWYYVPQIFGLAYLGRFDEAVATGERMTELAESPFMRRASRIGVAFADVEAGREEAARHVIDELKPYQPDRGAGHVAKELLFKDDEHAKRLNLALVRAGLPP